MSGKHICCNSFDRSGDVFGNVVQTWPNHWPQSDGIANLVFVGRFIHGWSFGKMDAAALALLIKSCAPDVDAGLISDIIRIESHGDPLELHVNGVRRQPPPAVSPEAAAAQAKRFMNLGFTVDIGLVQINSLHLPALSLSIDEALEPCTNLKAGSFILKNALSRAKDAGLNGIEATSAALSVYNTGDLQKGFLNGYVAKFGLTDQHLPGTLVESSSNKDQNSSAVGDYQWYLKAVNVVLGDGG